MSDEQPERSPEQDLATVRAEVAWLHQKMEEIRAATEAEILKNWPSPWKGADTVRAKVDSRLASNAEFREAMLRARDAQAREAQLDPDHVEETQAAGPRGHPAMGR